MSDTSDGLPLFAGELSPSVVKQVLGWHRHPELSRLLSKLISHTNRKAFLDSWAEAMAARQLLSRGYTLKFEVATPLGKRCDFQVDCEGQRFFLHVKRLDTEQPRHSADRLRTMSSRLRALERIPRPYIVQVAWHDRLSNDQVRLLVKQADEFIRAARVGDEMIARDGEGRHLGGLRIIAPWEGDHVSVTIGLRTGFVDQAPRFRKLMHRGYQQFMPRATNVILICSDHLDDAVEFETALLGSHIERWDAFPPRGKRVAHGRAADGFWHGQRFAESRFAGWFHFAPDEKKLQSRVWVREGLPSDQKMKDLLERLLGAEIR